MTYDGPSKILSNDFGSDEAMLSPHEISAMVARRKRDEIVAEMQRKEMEQRALSELVNNPDRFMDAYEDVRRKEQSDKGLEGLSDYELKIRQLMR